jgi:hypothetical protein
MIETQKMQDCSVKIVQMDPIDSCLVPNLIGFAVGCSGLYATSSKPGSEAMGIVISTRLAPDLGDW